ncbi:MAG: hypothetical protein K2J01_03085 [Clostridiales bacterium]|nr:hypothetical protein [Clostridiales bacterium]
MREEDKLNKMIRQDGINTQSEILEELKRRYPQYVEHSDKKQATVRKRKFAVILAIAAAAVCVAVIVPCAVLLPNKNNGTDNGGKDNNRYCTQDDYEVTEGVEYTIGEYRENSNLNFLYFDWYELGEECVTVCYTSKSDNEVLCLEERVYLPEKDEFVQLSITRSNVYLSEFATTITNCNREYVVKNHTVNWDINDSIATGIFEDNGYRYFIQVKLVQDENRLFELVAELLETK